jgi:hypothetical protein
MIKRDRDQGFTLPSALGMGFILMMLTAALLQQAHSAQTTAGIYARSELSTAIAEAGVARVQSFFDRQRSLVTHNAAEWSTLLQKFDKCSDVTTANHYAQSNWLKIPQGRYRVLSYTFTAKTLANGQIGVGKLLIEGQTTTLNQATSVIAVEIPVSINDTKLPVLWTTALEVNRHQKITGDVRVHQCPESSDPDGVAGISTDQINLQPDGKPSGQILAAPFPWLVARSAPEKVIDLPMIRDSLTLPRLGDLPDEHGQYHYQIAPDLYGDAISLPPGKTIQVNLAAKQSVNFYLRGNVRIGGEVRAVDSDKKNVPQNLRIYGGLDTTKFLIGDQAQINAMIHAPEAIGQSYRETGTATAAPNSLTGILWLKSWHSGDRQLSIIQAGTWADLQILPTEKLGVRIHPLSSWQRQARP